MCQAVRYVYPGCGHPIRPFSDALFVERCRIAHDTDTTCWMPQIPPPEFVQERVWYSEDLAEECAMCLVSNTYNLDDPGSFFLGEDEDEDEEDEYEDGEDDEDDEKEAAENLRGAMNNPIEMDDDEQPVEDDIPPED
ncbi:hypothetical protein N0V84_000103 [Fusarium piperis]|uniref:Uncharacterized protein n=1 Tax=Fusarium piperis TaxID=1435070 RepID=A0A9W9BV35_9HYPO|nr:hypothetical protein N0V84_000103 [Fusarium piperis]